MAANNIIKVTDLDFDTIKTNLTSFLSSQAEFKDYDFEASTMQVLLNLLAYNTYYNSFYLNMIGNEMFLDSATQRSSVVSRAKMLGYIPSSYRGASAVINLKVIPDDSPAFITVPQNTKFTSVVDGKTFTFVNKSAEIITPSGGVYQKQFTITEGTPLTFSYTVNVTNPSRYVIPNARADNSSIVVSIQESDANTYSEIYTHATNLTDVSSTSTVYFLQENEDGKSELSFGDGVLGKALRNGNIINISYRACNGTDANKLNSFTLAGTVDGYSVSTVTTVTPAAGGANTESIDSIKFNAPRVYESQNRAVTTEDYKRLILREYPDIASVSVWGGEENNPPAYGKVFISCKPQTGSLLSVTRKSEIVDYFNTRKVLAIEPEVVDATYLYVEPIIIIKYNPVNTTLTGSQLLTKLQNTIINYETNELGLYDSRFVHSQFVEKLQNTHDSIVSVDARVRVQKRFTPTPNVSTTYNINFNLELLSITGGVSLTISPTSHPGVGLTLSSSSFGYGGFTCYLDDDGFGNVRIYYLDTLNRRVYLNRTAGTLNYSSGLLTLNGINITTATEIQISVVPSIYDVSTVRNQLLLIAGTSIKVYNDLSGELVATTASVNTQGGTSSIIETGIVNVIY